MTAHAYFRRPPSGLALPLRPPIPGIPGIPPAPPPIPAIICCRPSMPVCVCKDYVSASQQPQHNHASFPSRSTISGHRHDACTDTSTHALASHTLTAHRLDLLHEHVGIHLPKSNPSIMSLRPRASVSKTQPCVQAGGRVGICAWWRRSMSRLRAPAQLHPSPNPKP